MNLNERIYVITDATGRILGDGECAAISSLPPDELDIDFVKRASGVDEVKIVQARIVPIDDE